MNKYIQKATEWLKKPEQARFENIQTVGTLVLAEYLAQQDGETIYKKEKKK